MDDRVPLNLTADKALVLFEYLRRVDDANLLDSTFEDQAEQRVLWSIECQLEKQLTVVLDSNHRALLSSACKRVQSPDDE